MDENLMLNKTLNPNKTRPSQNKWNGVTQEEILDSNLYVALSISNGIGIIVKADLTTKVPEHYPLYRFTQELTGTKEKLEKCSEDL